MLRSAPLHVRYAASTILMLIVTTIFGGYSLLVHAALSGASTLHPLVFALARDTIGTTLLLLGLHLEQRHGRAAAAAAAAAAAPGSALPSAPPALPSFFPARSDALQLVLCGVCGVWCSQAGSALALKFLDAVTMSLLQPLLPLVTAVASLVVGYEVWRASARSTWLKAGGLGTAVGGACFVSYASARSATAAGAPAAAATSFALGLFFVALQLLGGGLYSMCQKPLLLAGHTPLFVAAWGYVAGWCILVLCTASGATAAADWAWTPQSLGAAAYSGVLSSAFNYAAMAMCVDLAGPLFQAAFFPFMPVATVVLQWATGGGLPGALEGVGGLACAAGLALFVGGKWAEAGEGGSLKEAAGGEGMEVALMSEAQEPGH